MKLKPFEKIGVIIVFIAMVYTLSVNSEAASLSSKLVRLHVVANSDTDSDQELKLKVRDDVLCYLEEKLSGVSDREAAEKIIRSEAENIESVAEERIKAEGYSYNVTVSLEEEYFPTTEYDTFSLPAGEYDALRIIIGDGSGHNWWCVVFPSMCTSSEFDSELAKGAGLSEDEISIITENGEGYAIRFKSLELIARVKELFKR